MALEEELRVPRLPRRLRLRLQLDQDPPSAAESLPPNPGVLPLLLVLLGAFVVFSWPFSLPRNTT